MAHLTNDYGLEKPPEKRRATVAVSVELLNSVLFQDQAFIRNVDYDHTREIVRFYLDTGPDGKYIVPEGHEAPEISAVFINELLIGRSLESDS